MIGPEDFHDALLELSTLLLGEETMNTVLQRIVELTAASVPGCTNCGVSLLKGETVITAAATDGTTLQLDGAQYSNGEGPCLQAARTGEIVRVHDMAGDVRFPRFAAEAVRLGINSSLSYPLVVRDATIGALNIYGRELKAFDEASERLAERFARQASATMTNVDIHDRTVSLVSQLNEALTSRSVIDQARGILIARTGCSADEAIAALKQRSQRENRKLREIATEIVDGAVGRVPQC
ncbi:MAG: GAF and ANTAR domain-containing protein [Acidimicrobiales bacterium]